MRTPSRAQVLAASIVVVLLGPLLAQTGTQAVGSPLPAQAETYVDPASLIAPAAPAPIVMSCQQGQIDLNHATVSKLATLPTPSGGFLGKPVAKNILSGRPYLQPTDLAPPAVEGVTVNHVSLWMSNDLVCATPIFVAAPDGSQVPIAPDVCTDDTEIDVNDPSRVMAFENLFGRPTAQRLVQGMPYPSVSNALRRAGVGPGQLKKYAELLCATPYPIRFDGTDWAYATPEDGVALTTPGTFGDYTLTVPVGVTQDLGAWVSIAEAPSAIASEAGIDQYDFDVPTSDPHIHGAWSGPVGVTTPADPTPLGDGTSHIVIHYSGANGPTVHMGDAVSEGSEGRLTIAVDDLSLVSSLGIVTKGWSFVRGILPLQEASELLVRRLLGAGGITPNCSPDYTGTTLARGERLDIESELFLALPGEFTVPMTHCVTRSHPVGDQLDGVFGNNRGAVMPIDSYSTVTFDEIGTSGGLIPTLITSIWNNWALNTGRRPLLTPGATMRVHPDAWEGSFRISTSVADTWAPTVLYLALDNLSSFLPASLAPVLEQGNCLFNLAKDADELQTQSVMTIFDRTKHGFDCVSNWIQENGADTYVKLWFGDAATVGQAAVLMERLKRVALFLKLGQVAFAIRDVGSLWAYNGEVTMRWREPEPSDPSVDADGRDLFRHCWSKSFSFDSGWTINIDEVCQDIAYGDFSSVGSGNPPACDPSSPLVDAFDDWDGSVQSCRMYNVLLRNASGVLHQVLLEGGKLVAHPIAPADEGDFKEDWPEWEWRSDEFAQSIDEVGSEAVNDPLRLRYFTEGRGGSWLLRQSDGHAWYIDANGVKNDLGFNADAQQFFARSVLTLDPAQWAHDICPYADRGVSSGLKVC